MECKKCGGNKFINVTRDKDNFVISLKCLNCGEIEYN
jgi:uncharacterized Zn finger protein